MKLRALLILALLALSGPPADAGVIEEHFGTYLQSVGDQEFVSAIVYLRDQPDILTLDHDLRAAHATRQARHESVVTALRTAAARSQPAILEFLQTGKDAGTVRGFTPHWIMNLVVVSATRGELLGLAARPDVAAIEANFRATLIESGGQPYIPEPTLGIGVTNSLRAINADRVWRDLGITGTGTLVANLDTGVDGTHPALSARWRGNSHPWQECWKDALGTGTQFPVDNYGHGTHVMGTMCGVAPATGDTVGVAWGALWIADNAIDQGVGSEFDNDVLAGFEWFADPDGNPGTVDDVPDVVQNSWGISAAFGGGYQDCDSRWQTAIVNCESAGVVVTFSAGNEGPGASTLRSPANIANSPTVNFSVGAVDAENFSWPYPIASWSSRGPSDCDGVSIKPEVSAPGVNIYSSYPGGGYALLSGTSMAGPHVAGVVALMRQANPNADVQTIKSVLLNTARDAGSAGEDNAYGWGVIDAYAAVTGVMNPDDISPTVTVTAPNGGENLTAGSIFTITWVANDNVGVTQTTLSYSTNGGATWNPIGNLGGNPGSYAWTVPNTPSTQALVRVDARDSAGNTGTDTSDAFFTIQAPSGPYLWVQSIDLALVTRGNSTNARATVRVRDQNGNPVGGATVQSHWSGLTADSDVFTTKNNGTGTCDSNKLRNASGCWTYTIDSVSKAGYTFRNDLGEITDVICTAMAKSEPAFGPLAVAQTRLSSGGAEFRLDLPRTGAVELGIYNLGGQRIRTLVDRTLETGPHTIDWDGADEAGRPVRGGIYLVRATAGGESVSGKVLILK